MTTFRDTADSFTKAYDSFTKAYVEAALWSSTDDDGTPLDSNYDIEDIAEETLTKMVADCKAFQKDNAELLARWANECWENDERAGHDFWLTRCRHGAGYWDRWASGSPQGKIGAQLTELAHAYGNVDLYVGDDGRIYA